MFTSVLFTLDRYQNFRLSTPFNFNLFSYINYIAKLYLLSSREIIISPIYHTLQGHKLHTSFNQFKESTICKAFGYKIRQETIIILYSNTNHKSLRNLKAYDSRDSLSFFCTAIFMQLLKLFTQV